MQQHFYMYFGHRLVNIIKMNKTIFHVLAILAVLFGAVWLFNHINAWLGIALVVGVIIYLLNIAKKTIK